MTYSTTSLGDCFSHDLDCLFDLAVTYRSPSPAHHARAICYTIRCVSCWQLAGAVTPARCFSHDLFGLDDLGARPGGMLRYNVTDYAAMQHKHLNI